jgi:hypothetical protein
MKPFRDGNAYGSFRALLEKVQRDIDSLDNEYVLKASPTELEEHYVSKVTIDPLALDIDGQYIEDQSAADIDVSHNFNRGGFRGERTIIKGTTIRIAIPYQGDKALWRVRPSTFGLSGYPDLDVRDDIITFSLTFPDDAPNAGRLKQQIQEHTKALAGAVGYLARDIEAHNRSTPLMIRTAIERKRAKAQAAIGAVSALGIPIRKRDAPLKYTVPTKRRPTPLSRPRVAAEPFKPEPELDEKEFSRIIEILKSMSLVMERNPASFVSLNEEAIRTHFLLQLNGHYEGTATGETFNASGKTDILIRVENRNIFIAECKFWHGAKAFASAIDQLLTYLSWRDSKCALLIFNRTQDSTAVRKFMHDTMTARTECRRTVMHDPAGDSHYIFVKPSDPGREIHIYTMLFDVPTARTESDGKSP